MKMRLESLDEWVMDDHKTISYRWLANELRISSQDAKGTLHEFAKSRGSKLNVMHMICGSKSAADALSFAFQLVSSSEVEAVGKQFATISCKHVYSVGPIIEKESSFNSNQVFIAQQKQCKALLEDTSEAGVAFRQNSASSIKSPKSIVISNRPVRPKLPATKRKSTSPAPVKIKPTAVPAKKTKTKSSRSSSNISQSIASKFKPKTAKTSFFGGTAKPKSSKKNSGKFIASSKAAESETEQPAEKPQAKGDSNEAGGPSKKKSVASFFDSSPKSKKKKKAGTGLASFFGSSTKKAEEAPAKEAKQKKRLKRRVINEDDSSEEEVRALDGMGEVKPKKKMAKRRSSRVEEMSVEDKAFQDIYQDQQSDDSEAEFDTRTEADLDRERAAKAAEAALVSDDEESGAAGIFGKTSNSTTQRRTVKKLVKKTYVDEDGFMVSEDVFEEVEVDETGAEASPNSKKMPTPVKKSTAAEAVGKTKPKSKVITKKKRKPKAKVSDSEEEDSAAKKKKKVAAKKKKKLKNKKQKSTMMSFFKKI